MNYLFDLDADALRPGKRISIKCHRCHTFMVARGLEVGFELLIAEPV